MQRLPIREAVESPSRGWRKAPFGITKASFEVKKLEKLLLILPKENKRMFLPSIGSSFKYLGTSKNYIIIVEKVRLIYIGCQRQREVVVKIQFAHANRNMMN